ncbi:MAG: hypothetical protein ACLTTZ_02620 [Lachnospiraceae bacterium]|nr:hypothetical protein [Massilistercora timonensis]
MKTWKKPEVKVFDVKMDENIAASGDGGYQTGYIYYDLGGITRGGATYRWNGNNNIQDTGITFHITSDGKVVNKSHVANIAGCLA